MFTYCKECKRLIINGQTCTCGTVSEGVESEDF